MEKVFNSKRNFISTGYSSREPSLTHPDESLTPAEIMLKFTRGNLPPIDMSARFLQPDQPAAQWIDGDRDAEAAYKANVELVFAHAHEVSRDMDIVDVIKRSAEMKAEFKRLSQKTSQSPSSDLSASMSSSSSVPPVSDLPSPSSNTVNS